MKENRKETDLDELKNLKLTESVYMQLDSGRLDEWLAAEARHADYAGKPEQPADRRFDWERRLQQTARPWKRRLAVHRRRDK